MLLQKKILKTLAGLAVLTVLLQTVSCGFILYPERRGRTSGYIDPGVAILDAILFIPGILPGVVAFAVDFTTGCIYTSERRFSAELLNGEQDPGLLDQAILQLDIPALEHVLSEKAGKPVMLDPAGIRVLRVNDRETISRYFHTDGTVLMSGVPSRADQSRHARIRG
ncbi:hypothetical protein JCM14469_17020 [Desulfatiferula olefinivorans]